MITKTDKSLWNTDLAEVLNNVPMDQVWRYVGSTLASKYNVSGTSVILYAGDTLPRIIHSHALDDPEGKRISAYLQGAYLLDPFFRALDEQKKGGIYSLADLAPTGFRGGEYYSSFFSAYGLKDELNVFIPLSNDATIAISIGREPSASHFRTNTRTFLTESLEFLGAIAQRSVNEEAERPTLIDREMMARFHARLKNGLEAVGTSVLSPREKTILDHLLQGYSVKATAERLKITEGTIRIHRHSIYSKLDISSQNELFALVIEALKQLDFSNNSDPLSAFLLPDKITVSGKVTYI